MALDDKVLRVEADIGKFRIFADYVEKHLPVLHDFSFEKAVGMSDEEFAATYLSLMKTFKITGGWWFDGNDPSCACCGEPIVCPEELRMYHDNPYHPGCFRQAYDERDESELMKRYWARVLALR